MLPFRLLVIGFVEFRLRLLLLLCLRLRLLLCLRLRLRLRRWSLFRLRLRLARVLSREPLRLRLYRLLLHRLRGFLDLVHLSRTLEAADFGLGDPPLGKLLTDPSCSSRTLSPFTMATTLWSFDDPAASCSCLDPAASSTCGAFLLPLLSAFSFGSFFVWFLPLGAGSGRTSGADGARRLRGHGCWGGIIAGLPGGGVGRRITGATGAV